MSDDFGTVNVQRGARSREIEVIRQHYRRHRETLAQMIDDAPTEHLAGEYHRLIADIDASLGKLDEIDGGAASAATAAPPALGRRPNTAPNAAAPAATSTPGMRPLVSTYANEDLPPSDIEPRSRLPLIIVIALLALAAIGWLIWRASSKGTPDSAVVVEDTSATTVTTTADETSATIAPASDAELTVAPPSHDYGVIRKGTRATRQFEVTNHSDAPITISLPRSACRCLYYEYQPLIPPKGKESVTVTIDGARAKAGELREAIRVSAKSDPSVGTSFDVIAVIR